MGGHSVHYSVLASGLCCVRTQGVREGLHGGAVRSVFTSTTSDLRCLENTFFFDEAKKTFQFVIENITNPIQYTNRLFS